MTFEKILAYFLAVLIVIAILVIIIYMATGVNVYKIVSRHISFGPDEVTTFCREDPPNKIKGKNKFEFMRTHMPMNFKHMMSKKLPDYDGTREQIGLERTELDEINGLGTAYSSLKKINKKYVHLDTEPDHVEVEGSNSY